MKLEMISRFSPGNCRPELLESILVGRHRLLGRMEKSVAESIETGAGHHWLLIGPRGAGKTHVLAVLYNRILDKPELRSKIVVAYMKEEERGVASYLDWLVRILRAFHRRQEPPPQTEHIDLGEGLETLKKLPLDDAQAQAERLLIRFVGNRQLLLIAENLGELFDEVRGMGRDGQRRFRDLAQQHPFWTIVASSQALFEDIQSREAPFYGFFKVEHLNAFSLDDAVELLGKLAQMEGRGKLRKFFHTEVGRGRVRAIHQLTGGNPRLLVIFYQFIDQESIEELAPPFLEMVDTLTSYYQEQMHSLSSLQQKIVEYLCERRGAVGVKEIAQSCFITSQTASKQLARLQDRRFVVATKVGRQSLYELHDPLFRFSFEIKANRSHAIRLFVDFLGTLYLLEELRRKHQAAHLLRGDIELAAGRGDSNATEATLVRLSAMNTWLLARADKARLVRALEVQLASCKERRQAGLFSQALNGALVATLSHHAQLEPGRLEALNETVLPLLAEIDELVVACRLFTAGVELLAAEDRSLLMRLPREEREILKEILDGPERSPAIQSQHAIELPDFELLLETHFLAESEAA